MNTILATDAEEFAYDAHDVTGELFDGDAVLTPRAAAKPRKVYDGGLGIFVQEI